MSKKTGRNEKCPCGSGKKFKKCHGGAESDELAFDSEYKNCNALALEATNLMERGEIDEAFDTASVVFQRGHYCASWEQACHLMITILLNRGEVRRAEPLAQMVTAFNPRCPFGLYQKGLVLEGQGELVAAAECFVASIRSGESVNEEESPVSIHVRLAEAAARADRLDLLDPFLDAWDKAPPKSNEARCNQAICLIAANRIKDAHAILTNVLAKNPSSLNQAAIIHELGMCSLATGDLQTARGWFKKAQKLAGKLGHPSLGMLAVLEARAGQFDVALRYARRAVADAPNDLGYRINLASILAQNANFVDAIAEYDAILAKVPKYHSLRFQRAIMKVQSGQIDRGLEDLEVLERRGWEPLLTSVNIGVVLSHRQLVGDLEEALARHRRALTDNSLSPYRRALLVLNTASILSELRQDAEITALEGEDTTKWPKWASQELSAKLERSRSRERTRILQDVVRIYGEEAGAAMLTVSSRTTKQYAPRHVEGNAQQEPPFHIAKVDHIEAAAGNEPMNEPAEPKGQASTSAREQRLRKAAKIGIITALPKEFAAVKEMLDDTIEFAVRGSGAGRRYLLGEIPASGGGTHAVVLTMAEVGNNIAAARATLLLEHFPAIEAIIMVGIAGGVPNPAKAAEHVRLGDIVFSDSRGVVQYDFDKETPTETVHRNPPRPPNALLLESAQYLQAGEYASKRPWLRFIDRGNKLRMGGRPNATEDRLADSNDPTKFLDHPLDPDRTAGEPRVFPGTIASANKLLKNPIKRDQLRDLFGVKAVEMEASGVADASWNHDKGYFVVRGICDYCDTLKADQWQLYAAIIAAAYARALIESTPSLA